MTLQSSLNSGLQASVASPLQGRNRDVLWGEPRDIAINSFGEVYVLVVSGSNRYIYRFSAGGSFIQLISAPDANCIAIDHNDVLYAAPASSGDVDKYSRVLASLGVWKSSIAAKQMASDANGDIYIMNVIDVDRYSNAGTLEVTFISEFIDPPQPGVEDLGFAVDPSLNVYIIAGQPPSGVGEIQKFNSGGTLTDSWDVSASFARSIEHDGGSTILVVRNDHKIETFTDAGTSVAVFGATGTGRVQFDLDAGRMKRDANGEIYIADNNNSRIQHITNAGGFLRMWGRPE